MCYLMSKRKNGSDCLKILKQTVGDEMGRWPDFFAESIGVSKDINTILPPLLSIWLFLLTRSDWAILISKTPFFFPFLLMKIEIHHKGYFTRTREAFRLIILFLLMKIIIIFFISEMNQSDAQASFESIWLCFLHYWVYPRDGYYSLD